MNIALFGYGKMGKMIAELAKKREHTIVAKIDVDTKEVDYSNIDVAIDFSTPDAAFDNIKNCFKNGIPVVSGTTGWLKDFDNAVTICNKSKGAFIYASNFSLGVTIFFELNEYLAKMMKGLSEYTIAIEETHHTQKLDAPSGTAITLAQGIVKNTPYSGWTMENDPDKIPITSKRVGTVPGTHNIHYNSSVDAIKIEHEAHGREGFALGAVIAAEWLVGRTGVFTMKDVLNIG